MYGFGNSPPMDGTPLAHGLYSFNQTQSYGFSIEFSPNGSIYPVFTSQPLPFDSPHTRCNITFFLSDVQKFFLDYFELQFDIPKPLSSQPSNASSTPSAPTTTRTGSATSSSNSSLLPKVIGASVTGTLVVVGMLLLLLWFMRRRKVQEGGDQYCTL